MSMILVADREVVAEAKRLVELEAAQKDSGDGEEVVDRKAERRAAKQRKADEAQAKGLHAEQQVEHEAHPAAIAGEEAEQAKAAAREEGAS